MEILQSAIARVVISLLVVTAAEHVGEAAAMNQAAPAIETDTVRYPSGSTQIEAFVAKPTSEGKHPGVIVVHDDLGLTDPIRLVVRLFAQAGFVAIAPNLLSRGPG